MGRVGALRIAGGLGYAPGAPPPPDPPPDPGVVVGYGDAVTGGTGATGGNTFEIDTDSGTEANRWDDLGSAVTTNATRIITIVGSGNIDGGGERMDLEHSNVSIFGDDWTAGAIKKGWILVKGPVDNIWQRNLRIRPGDQVAAPDDADPLAFNAADGDIDGVLLDHLSLSWGPDVGGLTFLCRDTGSGDISNVTVQNSILGPGLRLSAHSEGIEPQGHHYACNLTVIGGSSSARRTSRITFWANLLMYGQGRGPQVNGADYMDFVNNVVYNFNQKPSHGNPRMMNLVGGVWRAGPQQTSASSRTIWKSETHKSNPTIHADSIYADDNLTIGFNYRDDISATALSPTILGGGLYHLDEVMASSAVLASVCANAGHESRDSIDTTLTNHALNGTSAGFYNGAAGPDPRPTWP